MPKKYDPLKQYQDKVSIWKRGLAFLIDIIIIQILVNLNFSKLLQNDFGSDKSLTELFNYSINNYSTLEPKLLIISIVTSLLALIYFTLFEWKLKQTLGKMLFKIKVTSKNKKLELWQALVRNLPKVLIFINYFFWVLIIDLIYYNFTKKRLFDKLALTDVAKLN